MSKILFKLLNVISFLAFFIGLPLFIRYVGTDKNLSIVYLVMFIIGGVGLLISGFIIMMKKRNKF